MKAFHLLFRWSISKIGMFTFELAKVYSLQHKTCGFFKKESGGCYEKNDLGWSGVIQIEEIVPSTLWKTHSKGIKKYNG